MKGVAVALTVVLTVALPVHGAEQAGQAQVLRFVGPYVLDMQVPASAEIGTYLPLSPAELAVAACESGHRLEDGSAELHTHRWEVENPSSRSSASGAFQFVDGTWVWVWEDLIGESPPSLRAKDSSAADQLRAFRALWRDGKGAHHWDASRGCWHPML